MLRLWLRLFAFTFLLSLGLIARSETRLLAPASLSGLSAELINIWPHEDKLRIITASSSQLVRQLEQGLEGDGLITANRRWMNEAAKLQLIDPDSRRVLLGTHMALVSRTPGEQLHNLTELDKLLTKHQRIALCGPGPVPCGDYARQALQDVGIWEGIQSHVIYGKDAAATRRFIEAGAVDYAILYNSDVVQSSVLHLLYPITSAEAHYELARVQSSDTAKYVQLQSFLTSAPVKRLFESRGFETKITP
ncbi:MAG: molybdate ABC transporter substrate-binding protein [Sphingomonadales bacterium]|jgi:molybdate transport system substrate-binding protein